MPISSLSKYQLQRFSFEKNHEPSSPKKNSQPAENHDTAHKGKQIADHPSSSFHSPQESDESLRKMPVNSKVAKDLGLNQKHSLEIHCATDSEKDHTQTGGTTGTSSQDHPLTAPNLQYKGRTLSWSKAFSTLGPVKEYSNFKQIARAAWADAQTQSFIHQDDKTAAEKRLEARIKSVPLPASFQKNATLYKQKLIAARPLYDPTPGSSQILQPASYSSLKTPLILTNENRLFRVLDDKLSKTERQQIAKTQNLGYKKIPKTALLGQGHEGRVSIAEQLATTPGQTSRWKYAAIKEKRNPTEHRKDREYLLLPQTPNTDHFPTLRDHAVHQPDTSTHIEHIVTDLHVRGDLSNFIEKLQGKNSLSDSEKQTLIRSLAKELITGIYELHTQGIYHQDIKPQNLLISGKGNIIVNDLGLASQQDTNVWAWTPAYQAPELKDDATLGLQKKSLADRYAVGRVLQEFYDALPTSDPQDRTRLKDLVDQLTDNDPEQRPSLDQALQHEYFSAGNVYEGQALTQTIDKL